MTNELLSAHHQSIVFPPSNSTRVCARTSRCKNRPRAPGNFRSANEKVKWKFLWHEPSETDEIRNWMGIVRVQRSIRMPRWSTRKAFRSDLRRLTKLTFSIIDRPVGDTIFSKNSFFSQIFLLLSNIWEIKNSRTNWVGSSATIGQLGRWIDVVRSTRLDPLNGIFLPAIDETKGGKSRCQ